MQSDNQGENYNKIHRYSFRSCNFDSIWHIHIDALQTIHLRHNPPRGITLKNDPPKVTSNQSLSSLDDKKSTSWIDISQAIGAIPSAVALFFVGFQTTQSRKQMGLTQQEIGQTQKEMLLAQSGFLKLDLECSYEIKEGKKYIVSKPLLENISRRPIDVAMTL